MSTFWTWLISHVRFPGLYSLSTSYYLSSPERLSVDLSPTFTAGVIKTSPHNEGGSSVGMEVLTTDVLLTELHSPFLHCLLQPPQTSAESSNDPAPHFLFLFQFRFSRSVEGEIKKLVYF